MPSFADSIFLFVLALLLFGPKRLPVLARELGKWVGEFRRASNEFKMQMEEELRLSEQADRQKQIAAMEAAAPVPPPAASSTPDAASAEPEHPHMRFTSAAPENSPAPPAFPPAQAGVVLQVPEIAEVPQVPNAPNATTEADPDTPATQIPDSLRPLPIATAGELRMMPPATGLPGARSRRPNPLGGLIDAIPDSTGSPEPAFADTGSENGTHGH